MLNIDLINIYLLIYDVINSHEIISHQKWVKTVSNKP